MKLNEEQKNGSILLVEIGHDNIQFEENDDENNQVTDENIQVGINDIENIHVVDNDHEDKPVKCYSINRYMLPGKFAYLMNDARYAYTDYLMLFYVSTGLSPTQAGLLNGLQYLGGIICNPFWGLLADKKGFHGLIVAFLCVMAIVSFGAQFFIRISYGNSNTNICPIGNVTTSSDNQLEFSTDNTTLFYSLLIASIFLSSFDGSINSFIDAGVLHRVQTSPRKSEIGATRYTGSVGMSLGAIAYSISIKYFPHGHVSCYGGIFVTYTVFALATIAASHILFKGISIEKCRNDRVTSTLMKHLKNFDTLFFVFTVLFNGTVQALNFSFLFLYLKELHAPTLLFGFSISLNSVSAVTVYVFAARIMKFLHGPMNSMIFSCFMWSLRLLCTGLLTNPFYVLLIDIFHGFTYSLFRVASLQYVKENTDIDIVTSMCGITNSMYLCCSFLIANVFGGSLYENFGAKTLLIGTSVVCLFWALISSVYVFIKSRQGLYVWMRCRLGDGTRGFINY